MRSATPSLARATGPRPGTSCSTAAAGWRRTCRCLRCSGAGRAGRCGSGGARRGRARRGRRSGRVHSCAAAGEDPAGIADGAADVLVAVAGLRGAPTRWSEVVELGERAGRIGRGGRGVNGPAAVALRRAARGLLAHHRADGGDDGAGMVVLAIALAELLVEIGRWQQARGRPHQAAAARAGGRPARPAQPERASPRPSARARPRARSATTCPPRDDHSARALTRVGRAYANDRRRGRPRDDHA